MDAELDILARVSGDRLPVELEDFIKLLRDSGVPYSLSQRPELRRRDIVHYANTHECISTVVIDSLEGWEVVAADRASDPWAKLACPLVTAAVVRKLSIMTTRSSLPGSAGFLLHPGTGAP